MNTVAVIFEGGPSLPGPLDIVDEVRAILVPELIGRFQDAGVGKVLVATDRPRLARTVAARGAEIVPTNEHSGGSFHLMRVLKHICQQYAAEGDAVICLGGGSGALMGNGHWRDMVERLQSGERQVIANSLYSSDIIGFHPVEVLNWTELMPLDNQMAWTLREAGLEFVQLPASAATAFDLDTPADVALFSLHPSCPEEVARLVFDGCGALRERLHRAARVVAEGREDCFLYGRIGSSALTEFEKHTRCRVRSFIEERGMRSLRREQGGAFSLAAAMMEASSPEHWIAAISAACGAAFLDTRVVFAHQGRAVSQEDRFRADLGMIDEIENDWVRRLAAAVWEAGIPIVCGGHSLVNGGLRLLCDLLASQGPPASAVSNRG